jgi:phosphate transport system substrate-binding protein
MSFKKSSVAASLPLMLICVSAFATQQEIRSIVMDGASGLAAALQPAASEFAKKNHVGVSVHNQGSKAAMECLDKNTCHVGLIPTDSLPANKESYIIHPFAISGLEIVVGIGAGIKNITTEQLQSIYSGQVKNWKELGGSDLTIEVYRRRESSGLNKQLSKMVKIPSAIRELSTSKAVLNTFKNSPGAITYIDSGTEKSPNYLSVQFNGVGPTIENYRSGAYKLMMEYFLVERKDAAADPNLTAFTEYLLQERSKIFPENGLLIP